MPVTFRCEHCNQLMSISRKKAGHLTVCPRCQQETLVPAQTQAEHAETASYTPGRIEEVVNARLETPPEVPSEPSINDDQQNASFAETKLAPRERHDDEEDDEFVLQRRGDEFDEMDLTPMVDVTFLLLIFFMVTASFSIQKSIAVPPPDPDTEGASQTVVPMDEIEEKAILVVIDEDNQFFVEDEPVVDPRDLPQMLAEIRARDQKHEVLISATDQTLHESVVTAMDAAQEIGVQRIRWAVESLD